MCIVKNDVDILERIGSLLIGSEWWDFRFEGSINNLYMGDCSDRQAIRTILMRTAPVQNREEGY